MARPPKHISEMHAQFMMPPLRKYWQAVNRLERQRQELDRVKTKASDQKRKICRCEAYPWPHRPGGGLCRHPNPPLERWKPKHEVKYRPYRRRYAGILRQIARASGLHPIRDRVLIQQLMPRVVALARQSKRQDSRLKYRNMRITTCDGLSFTLTCERQTIGPRM